MDTAHKLMNEFYDLSDDVLEAIASRYKALRPSLPTGEDHDGEGHVYEGRRTEPESIVFHFGRTTKGDLSFHKVDGITAERVQAGDFDHVIRDAFMERAGAEYWYKYMKDYG